MEPLMIAKMPKTIVNIKIKSCMLCACVYVCVRVGRTDG